jgi:outer membrane receptor for monomeric catechols
MKTFSSNNFLKVFFACCILVTFIISGVVYLQIHRLIEENNWVFHTRKTIETAQRIMLNVNTLEKVQRDFILTGNENYIPDYNALIQQVEQNIKKFMDLTADNPLQQSRIQVFSQLFTEYKKILKCNPEELATTDWVYAIACHIMGVEKTMMPTFTEMSYSTSDGLNLSLKPATSNQFEFGIKTLVGSSTLINASIYKIDTRNEISLYQQTAGRSVFQNIDSSERKGLELSVDTRLNDSLKAFLAYSYLDAEFTSTFSSCKAFTVTNGTTCRLGSNTTQANGSIIAQTETISAGAKIPGTYKHTLYSELLWNYKPLGFSAAVEARAFSDTNVAFKDDYGHANGYAIASLRTGFKQNFSNWRISEFLRVDNIFDKEYVGSIRVADLNENYFEPAPTRNYLLGINASYQFK